MRAKVQGPELGWTSTTTAKERCSNIQLASLTAGRSEILFGLRGSVYLRMPYTGVLPDSLEGSRATRSLPQRVPSYKTAQL
jgi:hypothetical protein